MGWILPQIVMSHSFAGATHLGVGFFSRTQYCCSTHSNTTVVLHGSYSFAETKIEEFRAELGHDQVHLKMPC